jgi:hypothetical protein
MAFFKSLIKDFGKEFFEPIGRTLQAAGIKNPNPMNPAHAWALRKAAFPFMKWRVTEALTPRQHPHWADMPPRLAAHASYAAAALQRSRLEISDTMIKHQLRLADRQCRMAELSQKIQDHIVVLTTAIWAGRQHNPVVRDAADILCQDLIRKHTRKAPSDRYYRAVTKLGETIANGGFTAIAGITPEKILMPY